MGYRVEYKQITVRFAESHALYGLEATFEGMDIETYLRVTGMDGQGNGEGTGGALKRCATALVSWNVETPQGQPVLANAENFMRLPHKMAIDLSSGWLDGLAGVPDSDPLPESSTSGQPSQVEQLPMEPLSLSPAS